MNHPEWRELFKHEGKSTTLYLYEETKTGDVDLVQVNDEGESITSRLTRDAADALIDALSS